MELFGRHDLVRQADPQRLVGFDLAAGEAQLLGLARADEPGEALRAAPAGDDAEQDLRLPEHRPLAGDPVVTRQGQLAAPAERVPADGGDDETGDGGDRVERLVDVGTDRLGLGRAAELGDVGAGGEDLLPARHHDRTGRIVGEGAGGVAQPGDHRARQRVHLAVGERDDRHPIRPPLQLDPSSITHPPILSASDDPTRRLKQTGHGSRPPHRSVCFR